MSDDEDSVAKLFDRSEEAIKDYDDGKCSSVSYINYYYSAVYFYLHSIQERMKETAETLEKLSIMIRRLDLFSTNEELSELSSTSLRYLLVPAYLGYALENLNDIDNRLNLLKGAKV